jgi:acyl carrier protein
MSSSYVTTPPSTAAVFRDDLLQFINEGLTESRRKRQQPLEVDGSTPLFDSGLIDSLAIMRLIAFVERATGRAIPPRLVVMKHFRTVDAICNTFGPEDIGA